jgi:hypothetical protein
MDLSGLHLAAPNLESVRCVTAEGLPITNNPTHLVPLGNSPLLKLRTLDFNVLGLDWSDGRPIAEHAVELLARHPALSRIILPPGVSARVAKEIPEFIHAARKVKNSRIAAALLTARYLDFGASSKPSPASVLHLLYSAREFSIIEKIAKSEDAPCFKEDLVDPTLNATGVPAIVSSLAFPPFNAPDTRTFDLELRLLMLCRDNILANDEALRTVVGAIVYFQALPLLDIIQSFDIPPHTILKHHKYWVTRLSGTNVGMYFRYREIRLPPIERRRLILIVFSHPRHAERYLRFASNENHRQELVAGLWRWGFRMGEFLSKVAPLPAEPTRTRILVDIIHAIRFQDWRWTLGLPWLPFADSPIGVLEACRIVATRNVEHLENFLSKVTFDLNTATDEEGNSVLHCWFASSAWRADEVFLRFLSRGADIHRTNDHGQKPFDIMLNCAIWLSGRADILYPINKQPVVARLSEAVRRCRDKPLSDLVSHLVAAAPKGTPVDARMLYEAIGYGIALGYQDRREGLPTRAEDFHRVTSSEEFVFKVRPLSHHHYSYWS